MMREYLLAPILQHYARRQAKNLTFSECDDSVEKTISSNESKHAALPLYVHIPFCKSLCPFCSFNRYLFNEAEVKNYYSHLNAELGFYAEKGYRFDSIHVGGGTPTVRTDMLASFIDKAKSLFDLAIIDVESTPNEITDENIRTLKSAGVNRLSIGVESFDDAILKDMGRPRYKGVDALEKIKMAKGKFNTVGMDLIYGFPSQSAESISNDLGLFKSSGADQITLYPLMPGPNKNTAIERRFQKTALKSRSVKKRKFFYDLVRKNLLDSGYLQLSAWCFSKNRDDVEEYINHSGEYVGIGSSSISLLNDIAYINTFSIRKYGERLSKNRLPTARYKRLDRKEYLLYNLLSSLFGMRISDYSRKDYRIMKNELLLLDLAGIIEKKDGGFRVTDRGAFYASILMEEFLSALNGVRETCIAQQV